MNELQHSNGTTAATIDSSGRILQPARPAWRVKVDSDTSALNFSANTVFDWNAYGSIDFDIGGHFNLSANKYVVPVTGLYYVCCQISFSSVEVSTGAYVFISVNGANTYMGGLDDPQGGGYSSPQYSGLVSLSANDEVGIVTRTINDTSVIIRQYTTDFSGYLVG